jgi:hypothetical protein
MAAASNRSCCLCVPNSRYRGVEQVLHLHTCPASECALSGAEIPLHDFSPSPWGSVDARSPDLPQLILSDPPASIIASIAGVMTGYIYRSDTVPLPSLTRRRLLRPLKTYRIPLSLYLLLARLFRPLVGGSAPPRRAHRYGLSWAGGRVELVLGWAWVCERERERESEQREKEKGTMMRLMRRGEEPEARGPQWASGSAR